MPTFPDYSSGETILNSRGSAVIVQKNGEKILRVGPYSITKGRALPSYQMVANDCFGSVVEAGTGLGLFTELCLANPNVTHMTTVEINPDISGLFNDMHPADPRLTVITGDIGTVAASIPNNSVNIFFYDLSYTQSQEEYDFAKQVIRGATGKLKATGRVVLNYWGSQNEKDFLAELADKYDIDRTIMFTKGHYTAPLFIILKKI